MTRAANDASPSKGGSAPLDVALDTRCNVTGSVLDVETGIPAVLYR